MPVQIRDARRDDLPELEYLESKCFSLPWTLEQIESQLPDDQHIFLVADDGSKIIGYVGMMYVLDEGYISNVAVAPDARRCGVGSSLIDELLSLAAELSLAFVTLEVRESNAPAISLYERKGFQKIGRRNKYYDLPTEDAILMTKFLK